MARVIRPQSVFARSIERGPVSRDTGSPIEAWVTPQGVTTAANLVGTVGGTINDAVQLYRRRKAAESRIDEGLKMRKFDAEARAVAEHMNELEQRGHLTPELAHEHQKKISQLQAKTEPQKAAARAKMLQEQTYQHALQQAAGAKDYESRQRALAAMGKAYDRPGSGNLWRALSGGAEDTMTKQFKAVAPELSAQAKGTGAGPGKGRAAGSFANKDRKEALATNTVKQVSIAGKLSSYMRKGQGKGKAGKLTKLGLAVDKALKDADKYGEFTVDKATHIALLKTGLFTSAGSITINKDKRFRLRTRLTDQEQKILASLPEATRAQTAAQFQASAANRVRGVLFASTHKNMANVRSKLRNARFHSRRGSYYESHQRAGGDDHVKHRIGWEKAGVYLWGDMTLQELLGGRAGRFIDPNAKPPVAQRITAAEGEAGGPDVVGDPDLAAASAEAAGVEAEVAEEAGGDEAVPDMELEKIDASVEAAGYQRQARAVFDKDSNLTYMSGGRKMSVPHPRVERDEKPYKPSSYAEIIERLSPQDTRKDEAQDIARDRRTFKARMEHSRLAQEKYGEVEPTTAKEQAEIDARVEALTETGVPEPTKKKNHRGEFIYKRRKIEEQSPEAVEEMRKHIRTAATEHGIDPLLFEALVVQESRYDPFAVSDSNALGSVQMLPSTFKGLRRGRPVSDLFDAAKATDVGAEYLAKMLQRYEGDKQQIQKALASYNAGPHHVKKHGLKKVLHPNWPANVYPKTKLKSRGEPKRYVRRIMQQLQKLRGIVKEEA